MPEQTKPTAEGSFRKTPFPNVLLYARERKMTGSFVVTIEPEDPLTREELDVAGQSVVVVEGGAIVAVSLPRTVDTLASVLLDLGLITEEVFVSAQEALAKPGAEEVPTLLRLRAVDPVGLDKGLREQTRRKVLALFGFPEGGYAYYTDVDLLHGADRARSPEDVLPIVWRGLVQSPPDEVTVAAVLDKIGTRAVRLRDGNDFDRFGFGTEVGLAATQLRVSPSSIDQLAGLGPDPTVVRSMVYLLALTKQLEAVATAPSGAVQGTAVFPPAQRGFTALGATVAGAAAQANGAAPSSGTAPGASLTDDLRVKEARALLAKLDQQTYFEMFDVTLNATSEDISAAFTQNAAKWHPDRAPLPELRKVYTDIFAQYNTAYSTLSDEKNREQYEASLQGGGGTPAAQKKVAAVLDTVQDVHRAEVALKRKDFVEAEKLLRKVLAANSEDPTTQLLLAQCLMDRDVTANGEEAQRLISAVIRNTEGNDRALFLMGTLLKAKNDRRYYGFYKAALEANPNHVEAQREVRLSEMRAQQRREANTASGKITSFFNTLLKKKK